MILPYNIADEGCIVLYILLFDGFMSFQAKIYETNINLLLYFIL